MALKTLSKTNISNGNIVQAADVSQSVDAFTGIEGYAISLSGSFTFDGATTGSGYFSNAVSASYSNITTSASYASASTSASYSLSSSQASDAVTALNASKLNPTLNASTNANYNVLYAATSSATYETIYKEDGNIMTYNPSTNTLTVTSSRALSASYADAAAAPIAVYGASYPSASAPVPSTLFKFIGGADKTGNPTPTVTVNISQILGKTLGQDCFVTATVSGSGAQSVVINGLVGSVLTFETQNPDTNFFYHILYI